MAEQDQDNERIRVFIEDHTGNKRREVKIVSNAEVRDLIPSLISALRLPAIDPRGQSVAYHLAFDNRQLQGNETLASVGVVNGGTITIVPEMTAGNKI